WRLRRRIFLRVLAGLVLAWLGASLYLFVWQPTDPPGRADAVVVLSGGRDSRLDPAIRLVERHVAPLLVISGAGSGPKWLTARRPCGHGASRFGGADDRAEPWEHQVEVGRLHVEREKAVDLELGRAQFGRERALQLPRRPVAHAELLRHDRPNALSHARDRRA